VQVNTGEEPQKAGVTPGEAESFVALCRDTFGLSIDGLMCIPPVDEEPAMHFALLANIAEKVGVKELSMGMSGDFARAISFGATYVRIGTAIFGARDGTALLLATDGVTDPFMAPMIDAGSIKLSDAAKLYQVFYEGDTAEAAVKALENIIWNTQVVEKKRIKQDDRTAMFIFMTHFQQTLEHKKAGLLE